MIIVSYDFENNRKRAKFSKFLKQFGSSIQYSVYEIKNSPRILQNILTEIELRYKKQFENCDSVIVLRLCKHCKQQILRYGAGKHYDKEIIFLK